MHHNGKGLNGSGIVEAAGRQIAPAPNRVRELADACVRFVERTVGVRLDYTVETLSILDHYVAEARVASAGKPEALAVVAHAAGAYFGEVVRRRYPSWWRTDGDDPAFWRIELEPVYLSFSPIQLVADALLRKDEGDVPVLEKRELRESDSEGPMEIEAEVGEQLELDDDDRAAVAARLAELPEVPEAEFFAPSTRLEVIDIAIEAIRARRMGEGNEADDALEPDDYDG